MRKFPIIIGTTGHRDLTNINIDVFKSILKEQIQCIIFKYPNSEIKLLTCLAEGADQLCAEVALELGISIIVPLPMEVNDYIKDFKDEALIKFNSLLNKAERNFVVPYIEETNKIDRDYQYRQAGIYIASHCHCLFALWDGSKPKVGGCGTAEVVDIVINHSYRNNEKCIRDNDGFVINLNTPRTNDKGLKAGEIKYLGNQELFNECCTKIDTLNKEGGNPDELSIRSGKKNHNALKLMAILGTIVTTTFLLYDEAMLSMLLIVLGIVLLFMYISYKHAEKSHYHKNYIEYRVLAECLRIQEHLDKTGNKHEVADYLDYCRYFDTLWIYKTMKALCVTRTIEDIEDIKNDWLLEQHNYHSNAAKKTEILLKRNNRIIKISLVVSVVTYIYALLFEYVPFVRFGGDPELIRTIIKIIVGGFSAMSLFAANYYGKLSLDRIYEDHIRMAEFFKKAIDYVDKNDIDDKFIQELINEELSENSNWCSYEKDNKIDLTV